MSAETLPSPREIPSLFFEAVEEASFPRQHSIDDISKLVKDGHSLGGETTFAEQVIATMDLLNMTRTASAESLGSLTSYNSSGSLCDSRNSSHNDLTTSSGQQILKAVESLTMNGYSSSNNLSNLDISSNSYVNSSVESSGLNPLLLFFRAIEEFLKNSEAENENGAMGGDGDDDMDAGYAVTRFPKFC